MSQNDEQDAKISKAKAKIAAKRREEAKPVAAAVLSCAGGDLKIARTFAQGMRLPWEVLRCIDEEEQRRADEKKASGEPEPESGDEETA